MIVIEILKLRLRLVVMRHNPHVVSAILFALGLAAAGLLLYGMSWLDRHHPAVFTALPFVLAACWLVTYGYIGIYRLVKLRAERFRSEAKDIRS